MLPSITLLLVSAVSAIVLPRHGNQTSMEISERAPPGVCNIEQLRTMINGDLASWNNQFQAVGRAPCYDWCSSGCTNSPDFFQDPRSLMSPFASRPKVDLRPACARHDFAYRNLKRYKAFNDESKLKADEKLREGIMELCVGDEACRIAATNVYFTNVRAVDSPAAGHNRWDATEGSTDSTCVVFPGCCRDHSSPIECTSGLLGGILGPANGDGTCMFKS